MGEPDERGGGRARRAVQGGAAEPVRDARAGWRVLARRAAGVDGGARRHGAVQAVGRGEAVRDVGRECGDAPPEKRAGGRGQGPDGDLVGHADAAIEEVQVCLVRFGVVVSCSRILRHVFRDDMTVLVVFFAEEDGRGLKGRPERG